MWHWIISILCAFFLALATANGQQEMQHNLRMRSITVTDGLPQGSVSALAQDREGFVWIASDGLSRYDGRKFLHFRHIDGDSISISSNNIQYFRMDDLDKIWITFLSNQIDVFDTRTRRVRHISKERGFEWMTPDAYQAFYITREAGRYFRVNIVSLVEFDPDNGHKTTIPLPHGEYLLAIGTTRNAKILAATSKGLYEIRDSNFQKISDLPPVSSAHEHGYARMAMFHSLAAGRILETRSGRLVIPVADTIFIYDPRSRLLKSMYVGRLDWGIVEAGSSFYANSIKGLIKFDEEGNVKPLIKYEDYPLTDVMLLDRSGVLWAATGATGIRLFDFKGSKFRSYQYSKGFSYDVLQPWFHSRVTSPVVYGSYQFRTAKDTAGNIWIINPNYTIPDDAPGFGNSEWTRIGVYKLTGNTAIKLPVDSPKYKSFNITFDNSNQAWLLTLKRADGTTLMKVDQRTGETSDFAFMPFIINENSFLSSIGNYLCVITQDHLRLYDKTTKACKIYSGKLLQTDAISLMAVADPVEKDILWIATKGSGIIRLNIASNEFKKFNELNGLPNNTVYYMAADKKGIFWCSSNKGLFTFDPSKKTVRSFFVKDGLQGNEFNRYHFLEMPGGQFVFGGTEGYTIFHPDSIHIDDFHTPGVITGITVNNKPFQLPLPDAEQRLTLDYNQNIFSLSFAGLQFIAPDELHYRYQLTGIDKEWVNVGNDSSARYTSIPPGTYTFLINATNTAGIWSDNISKLEIVVLPPWWKTWWAYLCYLVIVTAAVYALYRNWLFRLKDKQSIILHQKETEQLKAMDEIKSRFFNNITHEFRTPLSLIIAPLEQMQKENADPKMRRQLNGLQNNAENLLRLINQLLDISKLEAKSMSAKLVRGRLAIFIQHVADGFVSQAEKGGVELLFNTPGTDTEYDFDAGNLRKIIQNLLSNALKFTPAGGCVNVEVVLTPSAGSVDMLQLTVSDTGIGIPADQLTNVFTRFYQVDDSRTRSYTGTGIGLALVKELAQLMNGSISAERNDPAPGTTFTLRVPVTRSGSEELPKLAMPAAVHRTEFIQTAKEEITNLDKPLILVTEDHVELNNFISDLFSEHYRVVTAGNGKLGWEIARQEIPNLIISDLMMPEMDGLEFCRLVKTHPSTSHIDFLMLTAKSSPLSLIAGLQNKADDYLTKPFHPEELLLRVSNMIEKQAQLRHYYHRQLTSAEEPVAAELPSDPFLQSIYSQIDARLDDVDFTIDQLATATHVSARTLVRKLQVIAGITPVELLKQYRLKKAAVLLLTGTPVSEVSWSVGYSNRNYFSTAFKAFYGVSPSEYVKAGIRKSET